MTEGSTGSPARLRIQSLSDLIFGLALSIGALTLIGQEPSDFRKNAQKKLLEAQTDLKWAEKIGIFATS
jgi:hypothetical protein